MKCTDCQRCKRDKTGKRTRYCELTGRDIAYYNKEDDCVNKETK